MFAVRPSDTCFRLHALIKKHNALLAVNLELVPDGKLAEEAGERFAVVVELPVALEDRVKVIDVVPIVLIILNTC